MAANSKLVNSSTEPASVWPYRSLLHIYNSGLKFLVFCGVFVAAFLINLFHCPVPCGCVMTSGLSLPYFLQILHTFICHLIHNNQANPYLCDHYYLISHNSRILFFLPWIQMPFSMNVTLSLWTLVFSLNTPFHIVDTWHIICMLCFNVQPRCIINPGGAKKCNGCIWNRNWSH